MDRFFRTYQWLLPYAAIAASTILVAIITNQIVAGQLAPLTVPKLPTIESSAGDAPSPSDQAGGPGPGEWSEQLGSRCLFGCADQQQDEPKECPDGCADDESCEDGVCVPDEPEQAESSSDVPVESDLGVKLVGCMVADNPQYSLAMVQNADSQETYIVGPGDYLPEDAKVTRIKRDRIYIERNGQLEYIRLDKTIGGAPSPTSVNTRGMTGGSGADIGKTRSPGETSGGDSSESARSDGAQSSEDRKVLDRKSLKAEFENPREIARDARFVSNFEDGERRGVKLVGVSPSGLYSKLGFETGDVLQSVDGERMASKKEARAFVRKLGKNDKVDVVLERDGSRIERQFVIE